MAGALMGQWKVGMGSQMKERSRVGEEGGRAFFSSCRWESTPGIGKLLGGSVKVAQTDTELDVVVVW